VSTATTLEPQTTSARRRSDGPLRLALIGCGAISQQMHLPVLAGHEGIELAALVDRDVKRAGELAKGYGVATVLADAAELDGARIDAAIVATPPFHHAPCSIELMRRGIHVLVEKPMATRYADAAEMVRTAEEQGVVLHVGVFRRLYPSLRLLRGLLESEYLGRPRRFSLRSGGVYGWEAATLGNVRRDLAGGGILMDMGPHHLDQLLAVFDGPGEVLRYRDDARGGCEANSEVTLRLRHRGIAIDGELVLSRTRSLRNSLKIECERGYLEVGFSERYRVRVVPHGLSAEDSYYGEERPIELSAEWDDEPETEWYATFRIQIDDWLDAIRQGKPGRLSAASCLPSMRLIEECYAAKEPLSQPWAAVRSRAPEQNGKLGRVLITGASGFIGCRLAETLAAQGCELRAMVRKPANAARLARLDVDMVQVDLRDRDQVRAAMRDCDAVVHCAVGTDYWSSRAVADVTVGGTRNVVDAALRAGVKRFVHISSIAVHDSQLTGTLDESSPTLPPKNDHYGRTKLQAERLVQRAAVKGLAALILRPGCVYGPYGGTFITRPLEALEAGRLILSGSADTPANTVYVDNLVEAILLGLRHAEANAGEVFTIGDGDQITWGEFFGFFADALNRPLRYEDEPPRAMAKRSAWRRLFGLMDVVNSDEFRSLARKVVETKPLGSPVRRVLDSSPNLTEWLKRRLGGGGPAVYRPTASAETPEFRLSPRFGQISTAKAQARLGYGPTISGNEAREFTLEWWREWKLR
jgi:predicted dehydrogenase/nucleoside-diphosphate-sugar epimerase